MTYHICLIEFDTGEIVSNSTTHSLKAAHALLDASIGELQDLKSDTTYSLQIDFHTKKIFKEKSLWF